MKILFSTLVLVSFLCSFPVLAGGPINVSPTTGEPSTWASPIILHPEAGTCGGFSNPQMITKLGNDVDYWENVPSVNLAFWIATGVINVDVNVNNYNTYFVNSATDPGLNDSINPVVFDDDGLIVDDMFGIDSKLAVLGFAGTDGFTFDFSASVDGQAFFNCRCLLANPLYNTADPTTGRSCANQVPPVVFTVEDNDFTQMHEIGHLVGLDHTQVNASLVGTCNTNVVGDCDDLPAMYPLSVDAEDQISPQSDDDVALQSMYGLSNLTNSTCTVTGILQDNTGKALRCADIQATTGNTADSIATVSGYYATYQDTNGDGFSDGTGECQTNCGLFILRGLDPSKSYTLTIRPINSGFIDESRVGPCVNGQVTGIISEVITAITAGTCSAGQTLALGTIITSSTGGIDEGGGGGGSGGSTTSSSCHLNPGPSNGRQALFFVLFGGFFLLLFGNKYLVRRMKNIS